MLKRASVSMGRTQESSHILDVNVLYILFYFYWQINKGCRL